MRVILIVCLLVPVGLSAQSGTFTNPILTGGYPDPSICRVGDAFYIVNSSFEYFPGLPIHKSTDLVNWELVGYGLHRPDQATGTNNLVDVQSNGGIHAPTIRYNNGIFYIITTNIYTPEDPADPTQFINFIITAEQPEGPWSEPHIIDGAPGIDPDLFFDTDGKVWFVGTHDKGDKNRNGIGEIWVQELDLERWELKGERTTVWGGACDGCCVEGPHMYKKNSTYYLMVAEGGTSYNHAVMIAASKSIRGPFESNPRNPILTSRHLSKDNWVNSTGHADLVELEDGRWYMVALGIRGDVNRRSNMGRETHLIPVTWETATVRWEEVEPGRWEPLEFNWPVCAPETGRVERQTTLPFADLPQYRNDAFSDDFERETLKLDWNFRRVPIDGVYSLDAKPGVLRLYHQPGGMKNRARTGLLGIRQRESNFTYEVSMDFSPKKEGEEAGICLFQKDDNYVAYTVMRETEKTILRVKINEKEKEVVEVGRKEFDSFSGKILLKVIAEQEVYRYMYSLDGGVTYLPCHESQADFILSNGYTGSYLGLYATSNGIRSKAFADFDWVRYQGYERK